MGTAKDDMSSFLREKLWGQQWAICTASQEKNSKGGLWGQQWEIHTTSQTIVNKLSLAAGVATPMPDKKSPENI